MVGLISSDPALVAQLLKIINSSYYGLPTEVSRVQFAVAFLGLNEVYRMALSLTVINSLQVEDEAELNAMFTLQDLRMLFTFMGAVVVAGALFYTFTKDRDEKIKHHESQERLRRSDLVYLLRYKYNQQLDD